MNSLVSNNAGLITLVGRILLGGLFLMAGISKIGGYAAVTGYMELKGIPGMLLPVVIAVEVLGGAAIIAGIMARLAAFLLAGFSLLTAFMMHFRSGQSDGNGGHDEEHRHRWRIAGLDGSWAGVDQR